MDFVSNQKPQIDEMLATIGISSIDELLSDIPQKLILPPIKEDDGISEYEGMQLMEALAAKNTFPQFQNYLGAGAYEHHIPAIVGPICSKSEFLTSYTPYQAEASQGMLQIIFEFQSAICALTGLDVSNASLYDGASACAEAALMALRLKPERNKILISRSLHPNYKGVLDQYVKREDRVLDTLPFYSDGRLDIEQLQQKVDQNTAAILIQSPNFLGIVEDVKQIVQHARAVGALVILCANPLSYGLFQSASELNVDIAVGDCQPFGLPMEYGGPYVGYIACKQEFVRQLPGRIVGQTVDEDGKKGFVLTLQAREQHIRREKATSNICTNQALAALASLIAMLWYGKQGIKKLALTNYQRAAYLRNKLEALPGLVSFTSATCFNEFVIRFNKPISQVQKVFRNESIEPGINLGDYFPELDDCLLIAVTETKNKQQLDHYVSVASKL